MTLSDRFVTKVIELRQRVEQAKITGLYELWLYGSLARGTESIYSDIDILAVVSDQTAKKNLLRVSAELLEENPCINIIFVTPNWENSTEGDSLFKRKVLRERILVWKCLDKIVMAQKQK